MKNKVCGPHKIISSNEPIYMHVTADYVFNVSHIADFPWFCPKKIAMVMNVETSGDILLTPKGQSNSLNIEMLVVNPLK